MGTIEQFMWGYQQHYLISAKIAAEAIFNKLDTKLKPKVFLVGVLYEEMGIRHAICIEPDDCGYKADWFSEIKNTAEHFEAIDEDKDLLVSHPIAEEKHKKRLKLNALRNAFESIVKSHDYSNNNISFCSTPVLVEGYMVTVVLQLDRHAYDSHYSLRKEKVNHSFPIEKSLINATVTEFLYSCSKALNKKDPGEGMHIFEREYDEIIRSSGNDFMSTPAWAGGEVLGIGGLFYAYNIISSLKYEGGDSVGKIIIARREHPNIEMITTLKNTIRMQKHRAVRKLLEITSNKLSLLCDSYCIYGLGHATGTYNHTNEDLFMINFTKHYTWELVHSDHVLMLVKYGQPSLPKKPIDKEKFEKDMPRIFKEIKTDQIKLLWKIIFEATKQKHGTMIMISSEAEKEAYRLQNQSTVIKPIVLSPKLIKSITAIDGAVLINPDGTCYAIGAILDGLASKNGTPSRGARYNSAIRYVESSKYPCLAVVISEDETIDLIPDLLPQILSSSITEKVSKLEEFNNADSIDVKEFNKTMSWLGDNRFYLSSASCIKINSLRDKIQSRFPKGMLQIVYSDLTPNEEMEDSYFID